MKISLFVFILLIEVVCLPAAWAETVHIQARSGEVGHGWLFGSMIDGACWIVTPAHVVASPETGELEPFYFYDGTEATGQSAKPFRLVTGKAVTAKAEKEADDLAFARVQTGRTDGACTSRLGLQDYAYKNLLQRQSGFYIANMFKTSSGTFNVTLSRKGVDAYGGALLEFFSDDPRSEPFMHQGLSGATVMADFGNKIQPVAMVVSISADKKRITALRYDFIKKRFEKGPLPEDVSVRKDADDGDFDFKIIEAKYMPMPGDKGPDSLRGKNGCWKAAAKGGQRTVELIFAVKNSNATVSSIEVFQSNDCQTAPAKFWIDQRSPGAEEWQFVAAGSSTSEGVKCTVNSKGVREFRLKFMADKPVGVARLRLR
ncbi:MAG: hypothetical protein RBR41_09740 [Desulfovibrio sp.]|uniref:hypothetical protein n=1 Tax=Desulfovibrio sp. TaxID=885 RepID=UPI002A364E2A|nr:hypothetical protein [Desulfovibrio sp.]MDY0259931.1 hypothetical protein [Desulfovibrio sp.]